MKKGRHKSSQQISFLGFYHYCSLALYYPKTQWLKNNKHLLSQSFLWIITVDSAWLGASSFFFFLIVSFFFLLCFFPLPFIPHIPSCIFPSTPSGSLSYKVATKVRSGPCRSQGLIGRGSPSKVIYVAFARPQIFMGWWWWPETSVPCHVGSP